MRRQACFYIVLAGAWLLSLGAQAASETLKQDNVHIRTWNKFADDALKLHRQQIRDKDIQIKTSTGSYASQKDFYIQRQYYHNGRLLSQVQWENDNPDVLPTIEVYVHDSKGRVIRDFMAAYLPYYHNAPTQTLISFHHYTGKLHAFRTFDASGDKILERCSGENGKGEVINLLLDEDDLYNDPDNIIGSAAYNQCFAGLKQQELGKYIIPQ